MKTEQQSCKYCGETPQTHGDTCTYTPETAERMNYSIYLRRFKDTRERADIPDNKQRPYNLRHTRLTEVATFMGYEQLNKFAGWVPESDRAKVYVHLTSDNVNKAIRDEYDLENGEEEDQSMECPFCGTENKSKHSECRTCGRPLSLKDESEQEGETGDPERHRRPGLCVT